MCVCVCDNGSGTRDLFFFLFRLFLPFLLFSYILLALCRSPFFSPNFKRSSNIGLLVKKNAYEREEPEIFEV